MRIPKISAIFAGLTALSFVNFGTHLLNDHQDDIKQAKQADLIAQQELDKKKQAFYYDNHGNERGSLEFAYNILKTNAPTKHQRFFDAAENARAQNIHPLIPLRITANETGLKNFYGDDKDAQGYYQKQTLFLIENSIKYARDTQFYKNLNDNVIQLAIDSIIDDPALKNDKSRKARAEQMRQNYKTGLFDDKTMDAIFLTLREHPVFATQLMAQKIKIEYPQCQIELLPTNAQEAMAIIDQCVIAIYGDHLRGKVGDDYLNALSDRVPNLRIKDAALVQKEADLIQSENNWQYPFNASSWVGKANENGGPFADKENTRLGDTPKYFEKYVNQKGELVTLQLETIMLVADSNTGQSLDDYLANGDALAGLYPSTTIETSIRPPLKPSQFAPTESKRPQSRPSELTDGIVTISDSGYKIKPPTNG